MNATMLKHRSVKMATCFNYNTGCLMYVWIMWPNLVQSQSSSFKYIHLIWPNFLIMTSYFLLCFSSRPAPIILIDMWACPVSCHSWPTSIAFYFVTPSQLLSLCCHNTFAWALCGKCAADLQRTKLHLVVNHVDVGLVIIWLPGIMT